VLAGADGDRARFATSQEQQNSVLRVSAELEGTLSCRLQTYLARNFQRFLLPYEEHVPWVPAAISAGLRAAHQSGATVVFSTSPPIANHIVAWRLKQRLGLRWIADFRDPMVGNPFRSSRRAQKYDRWLESVVMRNADAVVANTSHLAEHWCQRYPEYRSKIATIWNGFDPVEQLPVLPERPTQRVPHLLTHVGSLYGHRHPSRLLSSLSRLLSTGRLQPKDIRVRLVGPVENVLEADFVPILETLTAEGIVETNFTQVPREEASIEMASADGLLLLDLNARGTGVQVPAKIFDYVRAGKPILGFTANGSAVQKIVEHSGLQQVLVFNEDSDEVLDRKILHYMSLPFHWKQEPSDWFSSEFDGRRQTAFLSTLLLGQARPS
jgi:hypothetical protein